MTSEITKDNLPKKLLKLNNLTFILPDNFNGNLQNALMLLAAYLNIEFNKDFYIEGNVPIHHISKFENGMPRVILEYGIFELDENNNYNKIENR